MGIPPHGTPTFGRAMSKYLYREGNIFLFRRRVPKRIQARIGCQEVYRSLKTSVLQHARQRAAVLFLTSERLFALAEHDEITDEDMRAAARLWLSVDNWKKRLGKAVDNRPPGYLRRHHAHIPADLMEASANDPDERIDKRGARRLEAMWALEYADYGWQRDNNLLDRMAEVMTGILKDYVDTRMQKVFRPEEHAANNAPLNSVSSTPKPNHITPRISEHVEEWQAALMAGWKHVKPIDPHSARQYGVAARLFLEILGDKHFGAITYEDAETFRDQILRLPASHGKGRHVHALEAIKKADAAGVDRISMKTAKRHNTAMNRYWEWLVDINKIPRTPSPFRNQKFPGSRASNRDREAWTGEQLKHIFESADYQAHSHESAKHWLPLISLHSGMRLEEMCRLRPSSDIQTINGVPCFIIQKHSDGWDPKTEAGERRVPIHPWLIEHGLMNLIEQRLNEGANRVFPELPLQNSKLGAKFSRDFSRFKTGLGYGKKHVFHSFRHTFRTELENTIHKDSHINAVMGHEGENRGEGRIYVKGVSVKVLANVVASFQSPLLLDFLGKEGMPVRSVRIRKVRRMAPGKP